MNSGETSIKKAATQIAAPSAKTKPPSRLYLIGQSLYEKFGTPGTNAEVLWGATTGTAVTAIAKFVTEHPHLATPALLSAAFTWWVVVAREVDITQKYMAGCAVGAAAYVAASVIPPVQISTIQTPEPERPAITTMIRGLAQNQGPTAEQKTFG